MEKNSLHYCPVCGFPTSHNDEFTSFGGTCPCCAFEFGIDESNYGINPFVKYRLEWIKDGLKFMSPSEIKDWSLDMALNNLKNLKKIDINQYFLSHKVDNSEWTDNVNEEEIKKYWLG